MRELKEGYCFTNDDLKTLQRQPLAVKVRKTQGKILEWCKHWDWNVYISFSGGKDSTVLLDLARRVARSHRRKIPAVFCDTGLEYPEIRAFVKSFEDVVTIRPEKSFLKVVQEHGFPVISKDVAQVIDGARKGRPASLRRIHAEGGTNDYLERRFGRYRYLLDAPFPISDACCDVLKKKPFYRYEKETGRVWLGGLPFPVA